MPVCKNYNSVYLMLSNYSILTRFFEKKCVNIYSFKINALSKYIMIDLMKQTGYYKCLLFLLV
jgi:hypothetical protein